MRIDTRLIQYLYNYISFYNVFPQHKYTQEKTEMGNKTTICHLTHLDFPPEIVEEFKKHLIRPDIGVLNKTCKEYYSTSLNKAIHKLPYLVASNHLKRLYPILKAGLLSELDTESVEKLFVGS